MNARLLAPRGGRATIPVALEWLARQLGRRRPGPSILRPNAALRRAWPPCDLWPAMQRDRRL